MATVRQYFSPVAAFARRFSTCPRRSSNDAEIIRRLRRQERLTAVTLEAEIDDLLHQMSLMHEPKSTLENSAQAAVRQNKYIGTERLRGLEVMSSQAQDATKQFNEFKEHLKDLEQEPHPQWQPGDSDVVIRNLSNPNLQVQEIELEMKTRAKDTHAGLDTIEEHYKGLLAVKNAWLTRGRAAAMAVADDFVTNRKSDYKHNTHATPNSDDLDDITGDMPSLLSLAKEKAT